MACRTAPSCRPCAATTGASLLPHVEGAGTAPSLPPAPSNILVEVGVASGNDP